VIWAILALAVAALGAGGTAVTLALRAARADVAAAKLGAQLERVTEMHGNAIRQLGAEATAHVDTRVRLERVVALKAAEIERLEGVLDEALDPVAVRERLAGGGLLSIPRAGTVAADRPSAAAGLPPRPATDMGTAGRGPGRDG
jgi:hypothetical protein